MGVRCKFKCDQVSQQVGWGESKIIHSARLTPVISGSEENKQFYAATPSGVLEVGTAKEGHFQVGKEYYLDITEAN